MLFNSGSANPPGAQGEDGERNRPAINPASLEPPNVGATPFLLTEFYNSFQALVIQEVKLAVKAEVAQVLKK